MTKREIFNTVKEHLLKQNIKSLAMINGRDMGCAYRGEHSRKCAIGCLIKDKHYTPELEGRTVGVLEVKHALHLSGVDVMNVEIIGLLSRLMSCHDQAAPVTWASELGVIELEYFPLKDIK